MSEIRDNIIDNLSIDDIEKESKRRRKTSEERIADLEEKQAKLDEERKKIDAQLKKIKQQKDEKDRKVRTHRLCQIGGLVEKYIGRNLTDSDISMFESFLVYCRNNEELFANYMNKNVQTNVLGKEDNA